MVAWKSPAVNRWISFASLMCWIIVSPGLKLPSPSPEASRFENGKQNKSPVTRAVLRRFRALFVTEILIRFQIRLQRYVYFMLCQIFEEIFWANSDFQRITWERGKEIWWVFFNNNPLQIELWQNNPPPLTLRKEQFLNLYRFLHYEKIIRPNFFSK